MGEFRMPSLGADMTEGTLTEWLVHPGDHVNRGDIVAVVDTAKADIEVECFESGVVERLLVEPGMLVPVGTALALIAPEGAAPPPAPTPPGSTPPTAAFSSPLVRHLAQERGVNLAELRGTGRGGRVTRADVLAAQIAAPPTPPGRTVGPAEQAPQTRSAAGESVARGAPATARRRRQPVPPPPPGGPGEESPRVRPAPGSTAGISAVGHSAAPGGRARPARRARSVPPEAGAGEDRPQVPSPPPAAREHPRTTPGPGAGPGRGGPTPSTRSQPVRVRATPLARRLAAEVGLDLARLDGTGAQGAVRAADVRAALRAPTRPAAPAGSPAQPAATTGEAPPSASGAPAPGHAAEVVPPAEATPVPATRAEAMRRAIGELMARSKREIPHYYLSTTVDLTAATEWLRERNLRLPVAERLVPAALLLKAAACAAREVPQLNGFWRDGRFVPAPAVHLGVAVSLRGGGLVAPAIHDAADLPLPEIMARLRDLVARARAGRLRGSETADPTITVTSLGDQGVEAVFGVIYPPQVALVGLGKVVERPWALDGMLGVRPVVTATLSADHRASDGATGARYLTALERLLQKPEEL